MNPLCCPKCQIALTSAEAERGVCPSCGSALPTMVAREGASRRYHGSPGYSSSPRGELNPDHIPQLARIGGWMVRIGGAGMLFMVAGCCGTAFILSAIGHDELADQQQFTLSRAIITGHWLMFGLMFLTFIVGAGLKVLAGEKDRH